MDYDFFKLAVDSLQEFPGIVGLIGGEPTLHPQFETMSRYLAASRLKQPEELCRKPIFDMGMVMHRDLQRTDRKGCGLWSTIGPLYYKYFEVISDSFAYQILNDHINPCKHQSLLMSWRDFGITKAEWIEKRDKCWIQNSWSATITPKGAFFCEVAGALDMLFDGPGGWDVRDRNWWKITPDKFGNQLDWCEICGAAIDTPARISSDGRDDVSPTLYSLLKKSESPKLAQGKCIVHKENVRGRTFSSGGEYMDGYENIRVKHGQKVLRPHHISVVDFDSASYRLGDYKDWIFVSLRGQKKYPRFIDKLIFNQGCIYIYKDKWVLFNAHASALKSIDILPNSLKNLTDLFPESKRIHLTFQDTFPKERIKSIAKKIFRR